jgi:hypothetical protein
VDVAVTAVAARNRGRHRAESLMVDEVTITASGAPTLNPVTGDLEPGAGTVIYGPSIAPRRGMARLRMPSNVEVNRLFGEEDVTKTRYILSVPHDVTGVRVDAIVHVTESDDAEAMAREFKVVAVPSETYVIDRKFGLEAVE